MFHRQTIKGLISMLLIFLILVSYVKTQEISTQVDQEEKIQKGKLYKLIKSGQSDSVKLRSAKKEYTMERDDQPKSFLQIKYAAEEYYEDGDHSEDTSDGEVNLPMKDIPYNGFTTVIGVGTPPQQFYWIFDTGSSVMFVK